MFSLMSFALQKQVCLLHQQLVAGLSLAAPCSDSQVLLFELHCWLRNEAAAWYMEWTQWTWSPRARSLGMEKRGGSSGMNDSSPCSQGLLYVGGNGSHRDPRWCGEPVYTGGCILIFQLCFPLPQKTTWKPSSWEMHPVATTSSSSHRPYGQRVASEPKCSSSKHC